MSGHEEAGSAAEVEVEARGRMRGALREAVARRGGVRRISGLSLVAVLCASVVAPLGLVGVAIGPVLTAWLTAAGSVGSNLLADVIKHVVGQRETTGESTGPGVQEAVAAELEVRMGGSGPEAAALRAEVAALLREHGAQQVLVEALAEGNSGLQVALGESMALLAGRFEEFTGLLAAVREGVLDLQRAASGQQVENRAQAQHRHQVQGALDLILHLLEAGTVPAGEAGVVFNALPPDTAAFTGRGAEIGEITGQVAAAAVSGGVISIHAIDGMPGVGKTALAVHVAHLLAERFPDRQLFVDLHAHTAGRAPADPAATLASLLTGDGLDPRQLPTGLEELAALWRTRMSGRRTLLVLDNAAGSAQVAPLLPGGRDTLVLITSRRHLGDLPYAVTEISLDVLPPQEAVAMFLRLAPRAAGDEALAAELVALAGHLPLAISLLARVYAKHRAWSIGELIAETRARLLTLSAEQQTVAAAFDLSYQALNASRQRFFRLLALHPGTSLDPYAAAALTGTSPTQAEAHLDALHDDHLVTEPRYRRYGLHDLVRAHARSLAETLDPATERLTALDGLLHYYAHTAQRASRPIARHPRPAPEGPAPAHAPALGDPDAAREWLRAESSNIEAAFSYAHGNGLDKQTIALAAGLAETLLTDGSRSRGLEVHQIAVDAAERSGYHAARATALTDLARVRTVTGDYPGAEDAYIRAREGFKSLGHRSDEATALTGLGRVRQTIGDFPAADAALAAALGMYREVGDRHGQATALTDLGRVRLLAGDYPGAMEAVIEALALYSELGNRLGEAMALLDLGNVRQLTGDYSAALDGYTRALDAFRALGNRLGEANALTDLGRVQKMVGNQPGSLDALTRALKISREVGNRHSEANALVDLGGVLYQMGDYQAADEAFTKTLDIYRALGHRGDEAYALNHYAANIAAMGDRPRALALFQQSLAMNRELRKPDDEAIALEGIAEHHLAEGDAEQGTAHLRKALEIFQRLGMGPDTERVQTRLTETSATRSDLPSQAQE